MWRDLRRWQGLLLISAPLVATVWLAATGQLVLYIHPRYVLFTVSMAVVGLLLVLASFTRTATKHDRAHEHEDQHGHSHDDEVEPSRARRRAAAALAGVATVATLATALSLIVLPPATLSAATATQRDISGARVTADAETVASAESASDDAFADFTVLDWSSLLRQTSDSAFYADKPVEVVGFITENPDDPESTFYVSRFVITCCAVDAQPIGVPVYLEDWRDELAVDQWVDVAGGFGPNPSADGTQPIVLIPDSLEPTEQPAEPYLF